MRSFHSELGLPVPLPEQEGNSTEQKKFTFHVHYATICCREYQKITLMRQ